MAKATQQQQTAAAADKAPKFLSKAVDLEGKSASFTLGNGKSLSVSLKELSPEIIERAALHGLSQKIGDSVSSLSKGEQFSEAFATMADVITTLREGSWDRKAAGGGESKDASQRLAQAILRAKGVAPESEGFEAAVAKAYDKLEGMSKEERAELRKNPKVAAELAKIDAEVKAKRAEEANTSGDVLDSF